MYIPTLVCWQFECTQLTCCCSSSALQAHAAAPPGFVCRFKPQGLACTMRARSLEEHAPDIALSFHWLFTLVTGPLRPYVCVCMCLCCSDFKLPPLQGLPKFRKHEAESEDAEAGPAVGGLKARRVSMLRHLHSMRSAGLIQVMSACAVLLQRCLPVTASLFVSLPTAHVLAGHT